MRSVSWCVYKPRLHGANWATASDLLDWCGILNGIPGTGRTVGLKLERKMGAKPRLSEHKLRDADE
jgi:hypothetical protein